MSEKSDTAEHWHTGKPHRGEEAEYSAACEEATSPEATELKNWAGHLIQLFCHRCGDDLQRRLQFRRGRLVV